LPVDWDGTIFPHLPILTPVMPLDSGSLAPVRSCPNGTAGLGVLSPQCAPQVAPCEVKPVYDMVFAKPAHFPLPRFGDMGETYGLEGVVIFEGMRFRAMPCGRYEVTFALSTTNIPVTLRLQLEVADAEVPWRTFTLTLPPLAIAPAQPFTPEFQVSNVGNYQGAVYHVKYVGFSPVVLDRYRFLGNLTRHGTARFGALPPARY
jgi:hypothetical protein